MKVLVVTMGPGETAQGASVAQTMIKSGRDVTFGLVLEENKHFINLLNCPKYILPTPLEFIDLATKENFDYILFCNSKIYKNFPKFRVSKPKIKSKTFSLDSNWLFRNETKYPYIEWLDKMFVNFTKEIFEIGLKQNGGHYSIASDAMEKIMPVGFIPENNLLTLAEKKAVRAKLGVGEHEKLFFSYFGIGVTKRLDLDQQFIKVFLSMRLENCKLIYVGDGEIGAPNIIKIDQPDSTTFYQYLASSDLVIQHQGLGTLEQAIAAQIPTINLVLPAPADESVNAGEWEVEAFQSLGLCRKIRTTEIAKLPELIHQIIDSGTGSEMIKNQKERYSPGNEKIMIEAEKIVEAGRS